jgi:type IV pilus assembly protein PilA
MQNPPAYPHQAPYQSGPPMPPQQQKKGFPIWVIILLVVFVLGVVFIGILAALGIYGTRKYLAAAKTAEAKNSIGAIARDALAAYENEQVIAGKSVTHHLCETASPVPASIAAVKGLKYMPSSASGADFNSGDAQTGWQCLRFSMTSPIYYRYQYHKDTGYVGPGRAAGPHGFEASAQGDLDANGTLSTFAMTGVVEPSGALVLSPSIYVNNELE